MPPTRSGTGGIDWLSLRCWTDRDRSVAVVFGLVGTLHLDADVVGLLGV